MIKKKLLGRALVCALVFVSIFFAAFFVFFSPEKEVKVEVKLAVAIIFALIAAVAWEIAACIEEKEKYGHLSLGLSFNSIASALAIAALACSPLFLKSLSTTHSVVLGVVSLIFLFISAVPIVEEQDSDREKLIKELYLLIQFIIPVGAFLAFLLLSDYFKR